MIDIYFEKKFGELYEPIEGGTCQVFEHGGSLGKIRHVFIKRKIPISLGGVVYYDLITPHGYGGPLIVDCQQKKKNELLKNFKSDFEQYSRTVSFDCGQCQGF